MTTKPWMLFFLPVLAALACTPEPETSVVVPSHTRQMIMVITPDMASIQGQLMRYEREDSSASWQRVGTAMPAVVGKSGLGWGRGLHPIATDVLNQKREGDGKSPAGVFRLSAVFGVQPQDAMQHIRMNYYPVNEVLECVDDSRSRYYNSLVYRDAVDSVDWRSAEEMLRIGAQYHLGVFVDHNVDPVMPDGGSCIFLHIWGGVNDPTIGCTAVAPEQMQALVHWLDDRARPVLVQLSEDMYRDVRQPWMLPPVD